MRPADLIFWDFDGVIKAKRYRKEAHQRLKTALEQTCYVDAEQLLLELEAWLRTKNESADSLLEAFEELLTLHRLKVPTLLRQTLMSTNPIESMFSLVRYSERNIKRIRGSRMLHRWLGSVLLYCEKQFKRMKGFAGIAQVIATIEAEQTAAVRSDEEGGVRKPGEPLRKFQRTS